MQTATLSTNELLDRALSCQNLKFLKVTSAFLVGNLNEVVAADTARGQKPGGGENGIMSGSQGSANPFGRRFGYWLVKRGMRVQEITSELFQPFLRARNTTSTTHKDRSLRSIPTIASDGAARGGFRTYTAATPAEQLLSEFPIHMQQERALAPITPAHYVIGLSHFLAEVFGAERVDVSTLCAADDERFTRLRAMTIRSERVELTSWCSRF
jgi:hypothetical protein